MTSMIRATTVTPLICNALLFSKEKGQTSSSVARRTTINVHNMRLCLMARSNVLK